MSGKDFTIGVLSVTAVILFTGLLIVGSVSPRPAMGFGQTAQAGDYIVTTSQLDEHTELVYVLNTEANRMIVYGLNPELNQIEVVAQIPLQQLLRQGPAAPRREREPQRAR